MLDFMHKMENFRFIPLVAYAANCKKFHENCIVIYSDSVQKQQHFPPEGHCGSLLSEEYATEKNSKGRQGDVKEMTYLVTGRGRKLDPHRPGATLPRRFFSIPSQLILKFVEKLQQLVVSFPPCSKLLQ